MDGEDVVRATVVDKPDGEPKSEEPRGVPNAAKAAERYRQQRDAARRELDGLRAQVKSLEDGKGEELAKLQRQIDEQAKALEHERTIAALQKLQVKELFAAGCVDIDVALGLLGGDGDVDRLRCDKPYLFKAAPADSTGAPPTGVTGC